LSAGAISRLLAVGLAAWSIASAQQAAAAVGEPKAAPRRRPAPAWVYFTRIVLGSTGWRP
jgi:hypothetical protein